MNFCGPGRPTISCCQTQTPLCLTRHIRTVSCERVRWPRRPRLLFITGPPGDLPAEQHGTLLRRALSPWLFPDDSEEHQSKNAGWITVLEDATFEQIRAAAEQGRYTHVHVLAHGQSTEKTYSTAYRLKLKECLGLLAASHKRLAEADFKAAQAASAGSSQGGNPLKKSIADLEQACGYYR